MFQNPKALYLFFALPIVVFFMIMDIVNNKKNAKKIAGGSIELIMPYYSIGQKILKIIFYTMALVLTVLALARPRWGIETIESELKGSDIFILLDISNSMACEDAAPSRLDCAKDNINEVLQAEEKDRYGLMIFSDENMLLTPLTHDYASIEFFLESIYPGCLGNGGTDIGNAINSVLRYYDDNSAGKRVILLITDGEDLQGNFKKAVNRIKEEDVVIFTAGIGTSSGKLIPLKNFKGGVDYIKDEKGDAVRSRLDEKTLEYIAKTTGGSYLGLINRKGSLLKEIGKVKNLNKSPDGKMTFKQEIERYDLFLIPALILFCLGFILDQGRLFKIEDRLNRIFKSTSVILIICIFMTGSGQSLLHADNQNDDDKPSFYNNPNGGFWGNVSFKKGNFKKALQQYKKAINALKDENLAKLYYNMANVYYFLNDMKNAQIYYEKSAGLAKKDDLLANIFYNQGLSAFKYQNFAEAAELFKKSLKYNDRDDDTRYNYIVSSLLKNEAENKSKDTENNSENAQNQDKNVKKDKNNEISEDDNKKMTEEEINKILRAVDEKQKKQKENNFQNKKGNSRMNSW